MMDNNNAVVSFLEDEKHDLHFFCIFAINIV